MPPTTEAGERVLQRALSLAQAEWGERLVASYALGSLAHGGFSPHVSDVDAGFVLSDPLDDSDAETVSRISSAVRASGIPLGDRLSIFWGSPATLSGAASGGRFPPLDRLDLKQFGRLLAGTDVRTHVRAPTRQELVVATAGFARRLLATAETTTLLRDPAALAQAGAKRLTKLVLYPARFLYTARTGHVGTNDSAVDSFSSLETGPAAELVAAGFRWRHAPPDVNDRAVTQLLATGLLPLYRLFVDEYESELRGYGEFELAQAYREWRERLT